jgi:hypothetical protein
MRFNYVTVQTLTISLPLCFCITEKIKHSSTRNERISVMVYTLHDLIEMSHPQERCNELKCIFHSSTRVKRNFCTCQLFVQIKQKAALHILLYKGTCCQAAPILGPNPVSSMLPLLYFNGRCLSIG